jgi:SAM-dependent methyltransferase
LEAVATWHYGLVARWWAEFNVGGPEIPYFRKMIDRFGQPALDVGCGTGRLLVPYLREGLDVDGCDVSEDMLSYCKQAAGREGLSPRLYAQPMHVLDLPRKYRTICVCGSFGLGGCRDNDIASLRRFYAVLEPGGGLVLDHYLPYREAKAWGYWTAEARGRLPEEWPVAVPGRPMSGGGELRLRSRIVALDPLEQVITIEMWAEELQDGLVIREEKRTLKSGLYFGNELMMMVEQAGFTIEAVQAAYEDRPAGPSDHIIIVVASKSSPETVL